MTEPHSRQQHIERLPRDLLRAPLDYLLADHLRQRVLCVLCEQIADASRLNPETVGEVLAYITRDMALHVIDEEEDFFPMLRRRSAPDDDIETVLEQLSGQHAEDEALANRIVAGLEAATQTPDQPVPDDLAEDLRAFARSERAHLALENATIMPLARLRLTRKDISELAARMAARRGILLEP